MRSQPRSTFKIIENPTSRFVLSTPPAADAPTTSGAAGDVEEAS